MKTTRFLNMMAASLVGVAFMSCSSQDDVLTPAGQTYTMSVTAQKGGDGTRALNLDGNTLNATWTEGDVVKVYNSASTELGELTAQTAGKSTILSGSLTKLPENDETLTLKYLSPSYSAQDGTLTGADNSIDKVCDYATATVTATVSGTNVTTGAATFQNQQTIVKFTLVDKADGTTKLTPTAFTMTDGTSTVELTNIPAGTYTTNGGDGVLYVAFPASNVSADITLTATVGTDTYTCTASSKSFTNGKYYGVTAKMAKPEVAGSYFTANSSGLKVAFSQGNLQATYNGSSWSWAFAAHQYDYIGQASGNTMVTATSPFISENATVDLFGWVGASSTWTGVNKFGITSATSSYHNKTDGYGNVAGESLKAEWNSTNLTITNGGTYTWRTPTGGSGGEWEYIFSTRTSGATVNGVANARYTMATINTDGTPVNGIILFPDGCKINSSSATSWGSINSASTWGTKCTKAQWTHLEGLGCVFLPAACYRMGTTIGSVGTGGRYCSSTADPGSASVAYQMYFGASSYGGTVNFAGGGDRYLGRSVRLVREVQ